MPSPLSKHAVIADTIHDLAELLLVEGDKARFRAMARERASTVSVEDLPTLHGFFHDPPRQSVHYDAEEHGLGAWLSLCQFSIFELIYNLGEAALPFIRDIAWGEYDWTQGNAIELLIRLAADGVQTEEIVAEISANFPKIRDEAAYYALRPIMPDLDKDENLARLFDRLRSIEAFDETYEEIEDLDPRNKQAIGDR